MRARIDGTVYDAQSGEPVVEASIGLEVAFGSTFSRMPTISKTVTDAAGEFAIGGMGQARATVEVKADGYQVRKSDTPAHKHRRDTYGQWSRNTSQT